MNLYIIAAVLVGHFLGDFVTQKNNLKLTRSKNFITKLKSVLKHLLPHTLIYSGIITFLLLFVQLISKLPSVSYFVLLFFFVITYIIHLITDLTITLVNNNYLTRNKRHKYFTTIGFDQLIHYMTLFLTIKFLWF
jgi:hypothetical protein